MYEDFDDVEDVEESFIVNLDDYLKAAPWGKEVTINDVKDFAKLLDDKLDLGKIKVTSRRHLQLFYQRKKNRKTRYCYSRPLGRLLF